MKWEGRSRNLSLRTALLRDIEECEWKRLLRYGQRRTREKGIVPEDAGTLVEEFRAETDPSRIGHEFRGDA